MVPSGNGCLGAARGLRGRLPWDPSLARFGLRNARCSRVLSLHRAPPTSGLRLPGLRSWPQAARRLVWIGRQKSTVKTKSFIASSIKGALAGRRVLRSLQLAHHVAPAKGWMRAAFSRWCLLPALPRPGEEGSLPDNNSALPDITPRPHSNHTFLVSTEWNCACKEFSTLLSDLKL